MNLADLRENYTKGGIHESEMLPNPVDQLADWIKTARDVGIPDANAMTVATANASGQVSSRTLLLKGIEGRSLQFFTNYRSSKAQDLAENPYASMTFLWKEMERQVCIRGIVAKTTREASENYFKIRPYDSQIGAWVSERQSEVIPDRALLEKRDREYREKFPAAAGVPCPDFWGGYQLTPSYLEFWQGRQGRLHDRLRYRLDSNNWVMERQSP
jgi:pyridoxamine 5'-phosphate oxidase